MKNIKNTITRAFNKLGLKVKKHSPEICLTLGVITGGVAVYTACKETLALEAIIDDAKETLDKIHENEPVEIDGETVVEKNYEDKDGEIKPYTKEVANRDKFIVYVKTSVEVIKNYAPALGLSLLSLSFIFCGFGILKKRNIALTTAYVGISESYKRYRQNIIKKYGEDADREAILGYEESVHVEESIDKNGNIKAKATDKKEIKKNTNDDSDYVRLFDRVNAPNTWKNEADFNHIFLTQTEAYANNKLKIKGHLFLNEVYDMLGMSHTTTGALCGWVLDGEGDEFVSFNIRQKDNPDPYAFKDDADYWLEFNCQGIIYDKI